MVLSRQLTRGHTDQIEERDNCHLIAKTSGCMLAGGRDEPAVARSPAGFSDTAAGIRSAMSAVSEMRRWSAPRWSGARLPPLGVGAKLARTRGSSW